MTYNEIFTYQNLLKAHLDARKCKRSKEDVILFEQSLSFNLWFLYHKLQNRTYQISGYHKFMIYEPKKREIQALLYKDRVVQHALCDNYLYPLLTKRFIYTNCACQKFKGTDFALDTLTGYLTSFYKKHGKAGYILKADIHHYFPSINHEILKSTISKPVDDPDILSLLYHIIDSFNGDTGLGIPMGNQTSQLFALYYLDPLDRLCKEKLGIKYYIRYMDDIIILYEDKERLKSVYAQMRDLTENSLKLEFNQKTQIFPIKNGVEFLGWHFYIGDTGKIYRKLKNQSKKRYKNRMKKLADDYSSGICTLEEVKRTFPGYNGHLSRGNTYQLQKSVLKNFVLKKQLTNNNSQGED